MKPPFQLPASGRYLRAKLLILLQPIVWGPVLGMVLLGLFTWPYWSPLVGIKLPEKDATVFQEEDANSQLSSEDRAVGADIDTLSLLLKETSADQGEVVPGLNVLAVEPKGEEQGLFDTVFNAEKAEKPSDSAKSNSPRAGTVASAAPITSPTKATQDNSFLNLNSLGTQSPTTTSTRQGSFLPGMEGVNPLLTPTNSGRSGRGGELTSPLQTAIEQSQGRQLQPGQSFPSSGQTSSRTGQVPLGASQPLFGVPGQSVVTPSFSTAAPVQSPTSSSSGFNSTLPSTGASTIPGLTPAPSIAPPVTTQTIPTTPVTTSPLGQSNFQSVPGNSSGTGFSTFTTRQQPLAQPSPPPFSVPRSIGNGQINTFSNP